MTTNEFVMYFMDKYNTLLNRVCQKYMIPNRYSIEDIKQYVAEKITTIMNNRDNTKDPITNPEGYFKSCLDYYGIEFQRMHGYIFDLPKRPRRNSVEEEAQIKSYGFKYLDDITIEEGAELYQEIDIEPPDPGLQSTVWKELTKALTPEETRVLECIYINNMTWSETSKHLGVAQSTCWFRKNRALNKIYDACLTMTGQNIQATLRHLLRGDMTFDE